MHILESRNRLANPGPYRYPRVKCLIQNVSSKEVIIENLSGAGQVSFIENWDWVWTRGFQDSAEANSRAYTRFKVHRAARANHTEIFADNYKTTGNLQLQEVLPYPRDTTLQHRLEWDHMDLGLVRSITFGRRRYPDQNQPNLGGGEGVLKYEQKVLYHHFDDTFAGGGGPTYNGATYFGVQADFLGQSAGANAQYTGVRVTGSTSLSFATTGQSIGTISRSAGSFVSDGFVAGQRIYGVGTGLNDHNLRDLLVVKVAPTVLTVSSTALVPLATEPNVANAWLFVPARTASTPGVSMRRFVPAGVFVMGVTAKRLGGWSHQQSVDIGVDGDLQRWGANVLLHLAIPPPGLAILQSRSTNFGPNGMGRFETASLDLIVTSKINGVAGGTLGGKKIVFTLHYFWCPGAIGEGQT